MPPPWLQDVNRAAQHLARLSMETDAQAALITRGNDLWAYAGELSQGALDELADSVGAAQKRIESGDLARFIRLRENSGEYMLYSTLLVENLILSLAFDAATRFSEIRSQAFQLARALSTIPNGEQPGADLPEVKFSGSGPESEPALDLEPQLPAVEMVGTGEEESPAESAEESRGLPPEDEPQPDPPVERFVPTENQTSTEAVFLDPVSPAIYNISFACVLIPRIPLHRLLGDLKDDLETWMSEICLSYGWRLSELAVHPDRLLWVVNMPPDNSASFMLETIRRQTSGQIFEQKPALSEENRSGDFWAPGYMILASARLPADEPVAKYIRRTRSWQGYR